MYTAYISLSFYTRLSQRYLVKDERIEGDGRFPSIPLECKPLNHVHINNIWKVNCQNISVWIAMVIENENVLAFYILSSLFLVHPPSVAQFSINISPSHVNIAFPPFKWKYSYWRPSKRNVEFFCLILFFVVVVVLVLLLFVPPLRGFRTITSLLSIHIYIDVYGFIHSLFIFDINHSNSSYVLCVPTSISFSSVASLFIMPPPICYHILTHSLK